tara:strand:+ start:216 stop:368 length:153 start_codon:yes stop_codon:yes gene_type:complete
MLLSKLAYEIKGAIAPFFYAGKFSGWEFGPSGPAASVVWIFKKNFYYHKS